MSSPNQILLQHDRRRNNSEIDGPLGDVSLLAVESEGSVPQFHLSQFSQATSSTGDAIAAYPSARSSAQGLSRHGSAMARDAEEFVMKSHETLPSWPMAKALALAGLFKLSGNMSVNFVQKLFAARNGLRTKAIEVVKNPWASSTYGESPQYFVLIGVRNHGHEELLSVKNDIESLLHDLGYGVRVPEKHFRILVDFDITYKGERVTVIPPTGENILREIEDAAKDGTSGLICVASHGGQEEGQSYFVSGDHARIFGRQVRKLLLLTPGTVTTIILETCESSNFLQLPFVYDGSKLPLNPPLSDSVPPDKSTGQLIFVAAARKGQNADCVGINGKPYGAMRWFISEYYHKLKGGKPGAVEHVVEKINEATGKVVGLNQQVQVSAMRRLLGPFWMPFGCDDEVSNMIPL